MNHGLLHRRFGTWPANYPNVEQARFLLQKRWLENFAANTMGGFGGGADEDLVAAGWTDISRRVKAEVLALSLIHI